MSGNLSIYRMLCQSEGDGFCQTRSQRGIFVAVFSSNYTIFYASFFC